MKLDPKGLEAAAKALYALYPAQDQECDLDNRPVGTVYNIPWDSDGLSEEGREEVRKEAEGIVTAYLTTAPSDGKAIERPSLLRQPVKLEPAGAYIQTALREAERFMSYYAGESLSFVGAGMPSRCLETIRNALDYLGAAPHIPSDGKAATAEAGEPVAWQWRMRGFSDLDGAGAKWGEWGYWRDGKLPNVTASKYVQYEQRSLYAAPPSAQPSKLDDESMWGGSE